MQSRERRLAGCEVLCAVGETSPHLLAVLLKEPATPKRVGRGLSQLVAAVGKARGSRESTLG